MRSATPAWLLILMRAPQLGARIRLGEEARMCLELATRLRVASLTGEFNGVWCHVPNEGKRSPRAGALLRALGMLAGCPDYFCARQGGALFIEMKAKAGVVRPSQHAFREWCCAHRVPIVLARSADEAWAALQLHKFV